MFLAFSEMRRAKVRFGLLAGAIALLLFLVLFQQSLQNSLVTSFIGAIRNQSAPVLVYSTDGLRTLQASAITPELEELVLSVDEVDSAGRIGQQSFTVETADGELVEAVIIGYEIEGLGSPAELTEGRLPSAAGEVVASAADADDGFAVGDTVDVLPGGETLEVVGLAAESQLSASPTLFLQYDTYLDAVAAGNPDAGEPPPNALGVTPAGDVDAGQLAELINEESEDLDALTRTEAAELTPGVTQVEQSFRIIFLLFAIVVPLVTGLFFLIVTYQKAGALTLLRAIGAPAGRLVRALLLQVVVIIAVGLAVGIGLYAPVSSMRIGGIPLRFETSAVIAWSALFVVLGVASALLAARRVLAIDPVEATSGRVQR